MIAIIQARYNSKRLLGKFLKKINQNTIASILINNLRRSKKIKKIVVATSVSKQDDKINNYCKKKNIACFRGSLENVTERLYMCAKKYSCEYFMRINGDSPFIDYKIIEKMIYLSNNKDNFHLYTNVYPRSYPIGQSIEIIKTDSLGKIIKKKLKKKHKEHVTKYIYENKSKFKIYNLKYSKNYSKFSLAIDKFFDLKNFKTILKNKNELKYYSFQYLLKKKYGKN